jgi:hypothetical protein
MNLYGTTPIALIEAMQRLHQLMPIWYDTVICRQRDILAVIREE